MWEFKLHWIGESGEKCSDTGRASGEEIEAWVEKITEAHKRSDLSAEVKIPTDGDSDWTDGTLPALRIRRLNVKGGPSHTWG